MRSAGGRRAGVLLAAVTMALVGCAPAGEGAVPTAAPTTVPVRPAPGPTRTPDATGSPQPSPPGDLAVTPQGLNGFALAGQSVVLLVTAEDLPVTVTATADHATTTVLAPTLEAPGDVTEVVVVPEEGSAGRTIEVTVTGTHADRTAQTDMSFEVVEGEDDRAAYAAEVREMFVPWLTANRPDLSIDEDTEWQGTMVSPQWLVVSHYLFFSEEWEMHVAWHIMVAPDDWARIDLRRRFSEMAPSEAFEISSITQGAEPAPCTVPESVWR